MADIPFSDQLQYLAGLKDVPANIAGGMGGVVNAARDKFAGAVGKGAQIADALATGGLLSPLVQLVGQEAVGETANRQALQQEFARNALLALAAGGVARGVGAVAPRIARNLLGRTTEIGVHHSPIGTITDMINPSVADRGITAWDQVPGYSYFWNTANPKQAASEVTYQLKQLLERIIPEDYWARSAYITQVPKRLVEPDPNVPGSIARRVLGGQRVVDRVVAPGDFMTAQFPEEELVSKLVSAIARNEAANQALQRGAAAATTGAKALSAAQQAALRAFIAKNQR